MMKRFWIEQCCDCDCEFRSEAIVKAVAEHGAQLQGWELEGFGMRCPFCVANPDADVCEVCA